jgi:hypothetical protein
VRTMRATDRLFSERSTADIISPNFLGHNSFDVWLRHCLNNDEDDERPVQIN